MGAFIARCFVEKPNNSNNNNNVLSLSLSRCNCIRCNHSNLLFLFENSLPSSSSFFFPERSYYSAGIKRLFLSSWPSLCVCISDDDGPHSNTPRKQPSPHQLPNSHCPSFLFCLFFFPQNRNELECPRLFLSKSLF